MYIDDEPAFYTRQKQKNRKLSRSTIILLDADLFIWWNLHIRERIRSIHYDKFMLGYHRIKTDNIHTNTHTDTKKIKCERIIQERATLQQFECKVTVVELAMV